MDSSTSVADRKKSLSQVSRVIIKINSVVEGKYYRRLQFLSPERPPPPPHQIQSADKFVSQIQCLELESESIWVYASGSRKGQMTHE